MDNKKDPQKKHQTKGGLFKTSLRIPPRERDPIKWDTIPKQQYIADRYIRVSYLL